MKRLYRVSTTALCTVAITVEADSDEDAVSRAADVKPAAWRIGDIFGEVDLTEGDVEVAPVEGDDGCDLWPDDGESAGL